MVQVVIQRRRSGPGTSCACFLHLLLLIAWARKAREVRRVRACSLACLVRVCVCRPGAGIICVISAGRGAVPNLHHRDVIIQSSSIMKCRRILPPSLGRGPVQKRKIKRLHAHAHADGGASGMLGRNGARHGARACRTWNIDRRCNHPNGCVHCTLNVP